MIDPYVGLQQDHKFLADDFDLLVRQSLSRSRNRKPFVTDHGSPIWQATFVTGQVSVDELVAAQTTMALLDGSLRPFWAHDTRRSRPLRHYGVAFGDNATLASVGVNNKVVGLSGLDAGFSISKGDRFTLETLDGAKRMFMAGHDAEADGSGNLADLEVRPHLPNDIAVGAVAKFDVPEILMLVVPGSVNTSGGDGTSGVLTFQAVEYY